MAASDTQRLAQGGVGPADRVDSGKSDTVTANLFCNERPQENALQGTSTRNCELRCLSPLTQFVSQPGVGAFGGWVSCREVACVEGYYEQVQI